MPRLPLLLIALLCLAEPAGAQWAEYPGAERDAALEAKAAETARTAPPGRGRGAAVLVTPDSFEAVLDFYRRRGREASQPPRPGRAEYERDLPGGFRQGPNGREAVASGVKVKHVIVILDGAAEPALSKDWVVIARPLVGAVKHEGDVFTYPDIRDTTVIIRATRP